MRFTNVRFVCWKKNWLDHFWEKQFFFIFWGSPKIFWPPKPKLASETPTLRGIILLRFFDPSNGLRDSQGGFRQKMEFSTFRPLRFLMPNKVLEAKKISGDPKKWRKKNSFSQKRLTQFFSNQQIWHQWTSCGPTALEFVLGLHF